MSPQVRTTPRKQPSQERSRATVESILEATARLLVKVGFDHLTTNAVAEAAGVSIGSLYQYFPNKEALVAAMIEQHIEERKKATFADLASVATLPIPEAARFVIESVFRAHQLAPELHRVIMEQVPRVGRLARVRELEQATHDVVAGLLAARRHDLATDNPDLAAFVIVSAIEAIVHRAVLLDHERLRDPRLVDEATKLITRYLCVA